NRDALLCRYASDGQLVWARGTGGSGEDRAYGIIQDADSNYFVTGLFTGIVDFGNTRLTCSSLFGTYVGKISGQGNFLWAVKGDGGANDFARGFGVVTDPAGNAVVNGFFSGVLRMGGFTLNATGGQYDQDGYILKFNTNGNVVWAKRTGGNGTDQGTDLHATSTGEIIEVGFFQDTARFANLSVVAAGLSDVFVAKYDSSGNVLWVEGYGGSGNEFGYGVTGDMLGNVFITGAFSGSSMFGNQALVSAGGNDIFMAGIADVSNSIPDNESSVSAFIYPNPSTGWFRFDCSSLAGTGKAIGIHIMDMAGKTTYHNENIDSQAMIDVSEIESGCYVVRFYNEDFSTCTRLVIGSR
ncbi:MAG: T9SS type A sorting domain-containing protein, partial [Bacteroidota bacterium]